MEAPRLTIPPQHQPPKGIHPLKYAILNALWWQYGYKSNFTVQTMRW